jgi:multidrug efflux pump subunit AcrB
MGVLMLAGVVMSNIILIVEFAHQLLIEGLSVREAIVTCCRVRLRPILMTSLAMIIGLSPMALKLGEGSESYAPLARLDRWVDAFGCGDRIYRAGWIFPGVSEAIK